MQKQVTAVLAIAVWLSAGCSAFAAQEKQAPSVAVTVEGRDGSRLVGTVEAATLELDTVSIGRVSLPLREVQSVEFDEDGETARVTCRHGDVLRGVPDLGGFKVQTSLGEIDIRPGFIKRIEVSAKAFNSLPIVFKNQWDAMDWGTHHAITSPKVVDAALTFEVTAHDSWLVRSQLEISAEDCPALLIRMKKHAGTGGQLYWLTNTSAQWSDDRCMDYETPADGKFHDIYVGVGRHPEWKDTITALRIDPGIDDEPGMVAIESIRSADDDGAPSLTATNAERISVIDGRRFIPREAWENEAARAAEYSHEVAPGVASFTVDEPNRNMKWSHHFYQGVNTREYPYLELRYRAENLRTDSGDYVLWLFDRRPFHGAGFEAVIARELIGDGQPHTLTIPLARFNPTGPIVGVAVRVASGAEGGATLAIDRLDFVRAPEADAGLSLLDGEAFESIGEWVSDKAYRSTDYEAEAEHGFAAYRVNDAGREMKWVRPLRSAVDSKLYPWLELTYRAKGLRTSDDGGCILWLGDSRRGNWGGFEAVMAREIVADGERHTIQVPLARFNPAGAIGKVLIRVPSGKEGSAVLEVEKLTFIRE